MPADALLLSLLQQLIVWLIKDAYRQVAAARGVERELERLERTLPGIQAMLADAEEKQSRNPAVKQWLAAPKDVAYDAEDAIDELNTEILWRKANSTGDMMDKVTRFVSSHNPVRFRRYIGRKLKHVVNRIDKIAEEGNKFKVYE